MKVTLKDGSVKEFSAPITAGDITKEISMGLYRNACSCKINGEVKDLRTVVDCDCDFEVLTFDNADGKKHLTTLHLILWHRQSKGFIRM